MKSILPDLFYGRETPHPLIAIVLQNVKYVVPLLVLLLLRTQFVMAALLLLMHQPFR